MNQSLKSEGLQFYAWSIQNPVGKIPKAVAKEGAGENRIPFAHLANSLPVYLVLKSILKKQSIKQMKVLDVGCGTGRNISYISEITSKNNYQFTGIDYSDAAIKYARKRYQKQAVNFIHYKGDKIPFPKNSFDYLISSHVIEHIQKSDGYNFLSEISRVLKKNGTAVIGTPNRKYCQDLFYKNPKDLKKYRLILPHLHEYYLNELNNLLKDSQLFKSYKIYQTSNKLNRKLMTDAIGKIKPKSNFLSKIKFEIYLLFRTSSLIQDLMAKFGTEYILRKMKVTYQDLIAATYVIKDSRKDVGDNFIIIAKK